MFQNHDDYYDNLKIDTDLPFVHNTPVSNDENRVLNPDASTFLFSRDLTVFEHKHGACCFIDKRVGSGINIEKHLYFAKVKQAVQDAKLGFPDSWNKHHQMV